MILDDWGLHQLAPEERADLLEIIDDRGATRSTLISSQLPLEHWHAYLNDPTLADAILDRIVHQSHKLKLKRESLRKSDAQPEPPKNPRRANHRDHFVYNLNAFACITSAGHGSSEIAGHVR